MRALAERFGRAESDLLDFSANINPDGPPAEAWEVLRACAEDPTVLTVYPDLEGTALRSAIGRAVGLDAGQVAVGNGFAPLLEASVRAAGVRRCLLPVPCFGEYRTVLERMGVAVTTLQLDPEEGFRYPIGRLREALADERHDCLLLANPQNPSGAVMSVGDLAELIVWTDARRVQVFLDEAFIDYVPRESMTSRVGEFGYLTVFRSLTKFYAIPGLRVSYAVAGLVAAARIREQMAPWAVTTIACRVAEAIVGDEEFGRRTRQLNEERRVALAEGLRGLGIKVYAGAAANYLLIEWPGMRDTGELWERLIREHGVILRSCANFEGLGPGHFRLAVRGDEENRRLEVALRKVLGC